MGGPPSVAFSAFVPEVLLQLLQRFIKHPSQIKQIHALLLADGHLLNNTKGPKQISSSKWKTTLLYNTLIRSYLYMGQTRCTFILFIHMLAHQVVPNNFTFPSLIKAASSFPSLASSSGITLHSQALKRGVLSDPYVQTSFVKLYAQVGDIGSARKMFEEILHSCIIASNAMIDAFGRNEDMDSALMHFESMAKKDVVSWTSVINGFMRNGRFHEAIVHFAKMMLHKDVLPNEATFVSVLSSCANLDRGGLYHGKQIHGYIVRSHIVLSVFIGTALIDLYGKAGFLEAALRVFNQMELKQVCTWNAMISSLATNGKENQALDTFEKMNMQGLSPNEVTFVAVLTACARAKHIELGLELFRSMAHKHGVAPTMEHYGCVVDLLGRAGLLSDATEFIRNMPFQPDASVLGALLGACKIHGALELGNQVGKRLLELQTKHCGHYVALSSINAIWEKWVYASDWRKVMVEAGIGNTPAYSLIASR